MNKPAVTGLVVLGLAVALTGCGSGGSKDSASGEGGRGNSGEVVVTMKSTQFEKTKLEVNAGTTVKFVNQDQVAHSVWEGVPDSGKHLFKSADYGKGKDFSYTFDKPGTYKIFCNTASHHLIGMKMEIVVQ